MPRAKRTDRAEARRRYRASLDAAESGEDLEDESPAASTRAAPPTSSTKAPRPSIASAFRTAFHPLTLREDLRELPALLRHKSVWIPTLLIILVGVAAIATGGDNQAVRLILYYFLLPPAMGPAFIGGFLAPRASYLVGFIVGIVSAVTYALVVVTAVQVLPETTTETQAAVQDLILFAFTSSPLFGLFFAAAAAWYRRFLRLSNPNRYRQQPQQGRGSDGRSRSKGSQRAPGRR